MIFDRHDFTTPPRELGRSRRHLTDCKEGEQSTTEAVIGRERERERTSVVESLKNPRSRLRFERADKVETDLHELIDSEFHVASHWRSILLLTHRNSSRWIRISVLGELVFVASKRCLFKFKFLFQRDIVDSFDFANVVAVDHPPVDDFEPPSADRIDDTPSIVHDVATCDSKHRSVLIDTS